jgi:two-component system sensor histidine kinase/response regulator
VIEYQEKRKINMDNLASEYTVLIVDDVPTNVMLVQAILKKEGYTLLTCDSGAKALRIAHDKHPNLILLDIMMPEMDGYEVLQHLKSAPDTNDIPVIIMSALSDMQSIVKGYQLGATEYVTKPFQREELVKRVAHRYELFSIKRIKQELENTIESRDTLYSVIAHDLRSPLGSLKMMNNAILMMVDKSQVSPEVFEMLQMMNKTSEEIFLLLDNLLKWAKNRLKKQNIYKQDADINSLVSSTAEMYIPMAAQKGISIRLLDVEKELVGSVDIDMIKTVIRNLISNAIKFSFEGGTIDVSTSIEGNNVIVSVKDSGKGIKKEDQEKLLKANTHFTSYGTSNEKGSGLGLMLCKDFVELHDGKLWFESEEGKGSTFLFSLKALNKE